MFSSSKIKEGKLPRGMPCVAGMVGNLSSMPWFFVRTDLDAPAILWDFGVFGFFGVVRLVLLRVALVFFRWDFFWGVFSLISFLLL